MDPKRHQQAAWTFPTCRPAGTGSSEWVSPQKFPRASSGLPREKLDRAELQAAGSWDPFIWSSKEPRAQQGIHPCQPPPKCWAVWKVFALQTFFFFHSVMDKSEASSLQKVQCVPFLDLASWSRTHVLIQGHADLWVHPSHLPWSCLLKKKWAGVVFSVIVASWISVTLVWRQAEITDCRNRKLHIKAFCQLLRIPWQYYVLLKISCTRARTVAKKMRGRILVYHHVSSHSYLKLKKSCCFLFPVCKLSCQQIDH